jgi:cytochrome c553
MRVPFALAALLLASSPAWADDSAASKAKAEPCAACHGEKGISEAPKVPSLAGQVDEAIQWQLVYFRSGSRRNEAMEQLAADLTNPDIRALGAYFASLPHFAPTGPDSNPALTEVGAKIAAARGCGRCHGADFAGIRAAARLAGQREDYLLKALRDFKSGARTGGGIASMPETVYPLSDEQLIALAHYLSRLP